jgi:hypothetical protein
VVQDLLYGLVANRGDEPAEMMGEINGIAQLTNLPAKGLQAVQMLYELQTLMVPIENVTLPWKGPGCTGIIAVNKNDGTVTHARNLDFSPKFYMQNLTYIAKFTVKGKEVFRAQMIAAYQCAVTGMKMGNNGFTIEVNTRYTDHVRGNTEMFHHLLKDKRPLNGWSIRKILQNSADYEAALSALETVKYVATTYNIISGVKKGAILARNPDNVAYKLTLGQPNFQCRDDYIIITNFDFFYHDIREFFDPTGGDGIGHPRRVAAQKLLNASATLTPEVLFSVIDDHAVRATDTIFQAIMNVETGLFNVSLPPFDGP